MKVAKSRTRVRATGLPLTDDEIAFSDKISYAPEIEVRESFAKICHEIFDVFPTTTGLVKRVFEQYVRCCDLVDDAKVALLPQKLVNQRPTIALLSSSSDMFDSLLILIDREAGVLPLGQTISTALPCYYPFPALKFGGFVSLLPSKSLVIDCDEQKTGERITTSAIVGARYGGHV